MQLPATLIVAASKSALSPAFSIALTTTAASLALDLSAYPNGPAPAGVVFNEESKTWSALASCRSTGAVDRTRRAIAWRMFTAQICPIVLPIFR
jgi:hypothetical protein